MQVNAGGNAAFQAALNACYKKTKCTEGKVHLHPINVHFFSFSPHVLEFITKMKYFEYSSNHL